MPPLRGRLSRAKHASDQFYLRELPERLISHNSNCYFGVHETTRPAIGRLHWFCASPHRAGFNSAGATRAPPPNDSRHTTK